MTWPDALMEQCVCHPGCCEDECGACESVRACLRARWTISREDA